MDDWAWIRGKACRVVGGTDVKIETKESAHQTSGHTADGGGRERLGKGQVCKWGVGRSRDSKVEREREKLSLM